jgi:hypothetical protein
MEYVRRCYLECNGKTIDDFKSVTDKEVELYKPVNLMNKTGFASVTPRYAVEVEYLVPDSSPEFDWKELKNGTLTIELMNKKRITFTGCYTLKIGAMKIDGDGDTVRTIEVGAVDRKEN